MTLSCQFVENMPLAPNYIEELFLECVCIDGLVGLIGLELCLFFKASKVDYTYAFCYLTGVIKTLTAF